MTHLSFCFLKVCISLSPSNPQAHSLLGCVTGALSVSLRDTPPCFVTSTSSLGQRDTLLAPSWLCPHMASVSLSCCWTFCRDLHNFPEEGDASQIMEAIHTTRAKIQLRNWWALILSLLFTSPGVTG